tara:strand:+ start:410 stop:598 length:189 start_codon:yes stop_codon:yes gene_type:complete
MDEIHDGDVLKELFAKKDKLIASQKETIALLTNQLNNEKLKNDNLDLLVRVSDKNLTKPTED